MHARNLWAGWSGGGGTSLQSLKLNFSFYFKSSEWMIPLYLFNNGLKNDNFLSKNKSFCLKNDNFCLNVR